MVRKGNHPRMSLPSSNLLYSNVLMENPPFIEYVPIKTSIHRGFPLPLYRRGGGHFSSGHQAHLHRVVRSSLVKANIDAQFCFPLNKSVHIGIPYYICWFGGRVLGVTYPTSYSETYLIFVNHADLQWFKSWKVVPLAISLFLNSSFYVLPSGKLT